MREQSASKGNIIKITYMKRIVFALVLSILAVVSFAGNDKTIVPSILKEATVYRVGAELVHTARASLLPGTNELVIEGISNRIDINSVQIGTEGKLTILSLEFSTDYMRPLVKSALVKRLEDSLEQVKKEYAKVQVQIKTSKELLDLLKANKQIGGTQTGLSVAELIKMMDYYKLKTLELENEMSGYREKEIKLLETIEKIRLQISEEEQKNTKSTGKLLLQVLSPLAGTYNFNISYVTSSAFWNASYDLKSESISKPVNITYKAKIVQTTGIDWKNVKLTLATSTPSQQGTAPIFQTWFLGYIDPVARMESTMMNTVPSMLQGRAAGVMVEKDMAGSISGIKLQGSNSNIKNDPVYVVNGNIVSEKEFKELDPNMIKKIDILKDASATSIYGARAANGVILVTLKDGNDYVTMNDNELNVTFSIDVPYDVPSNGKEQQVILKEFSVPAFFKYYSAPKLDKEAYLLAEVSDWEELNLLPGEANIMFEGTYIGKTYIDPNSTQDTLNFTLGRDKRVVVKREKSKDYSSIKFFGANKKQVFTYDITVKNNKKEKVDMILKDQFPVSTNKDIEVELLESNGAAINNDLGVLTWKLELAAGESKKFRISYSVKYPKDKVLNL
jgi:TonB-dependent SusC/RagA subfamily outer membrane receptor